MIGLLNITNVILGLKEQDRLNHYANIYNKQQKKV